MKRKVVSVILCGTMVLGMVTGCGSSSSTASTTAAATTTAAAAETTKESVSEQIRDFKSASGSR